MSANPKQASGRSLVLTSVVFYGILLAVAACWAWLADRSLLVFPGHLEIAADPWGQVLRGLVAGTGFGIVVALLSRWSDRRFAWARRMNRSFRNVIGALSGWEILVLALVSAVGEEALFRGALQPAVGLWASALIFGAVHVPLQRDLWMWPVMAALVGLALGGAFERWGSLAGPVAAHFTINLLNLWQICGPDSGGGGEGAEQGADADAGRSEREEEEENLPVRIEASTILPG